MTTHPAPIETSDAAPSTAVPGDERIGEYARRWWAGIKGGELGSLPIVLGLIIIAIVFQSQNSQFLTAGNFVNLIVQMAAITTIAMGIVFILLLGEIDLSVGYVSGVAGVIAALLLIPDGNQVPTAVGIAAALAAGGAIGVLHGLIITKVGVPSFVVTLAGLLGWNGVVLLLIGSRGTVILQNNTIVGFANNFLPDAMAWILLAAALALYAGVLLLARRARAKAGLPALPDLLLALRVGGLGLVGAIVVYVANEDRGIPYVFLVLTAAYIVWTYVLNRTRFGRHVYAVGGNAEAARRAGISVDKVRIACFAICSFMAALGGIVLASRLRSVDTGAGGGSIQLYSIAAAVIGGTSLFGGKGRMIDAVIGGTVLAIVTNGLGLLNQTSAVVNIVTGLVLLLAASVDALSRRRATASAR
jgi:D-xylose transport system permease protein